MDKFLYLMICYVYIRVKLAPPTYLGAWSMAGLPGQPLEYLFTSVPQENSSERMQLEHLVW